MHIYLPFLTVSKYSNAKIRVILPVVAGLPGYC